jgi:hypothetical protein
MMPLKLRSTGPSSGPYTVFSGEWAIGHITEDLGSPQNHLRWLWILDGVLARPSDMRTSGRAAFLNAAGKLASLEGVGERGRGGGRNALAATGGLITQFTALTAIQAKSLSYPIGTSRREWRENQRNRHDIFAGPPRTRDVQHAQVTKNLERCFCALQRSTAS